MKRTEASKKQTSINSFFTIKKKAVDKEKKEEVAETTEKCEEVWKHPLFQGLTEESWRRVLGPVFKKYLNNKDLMNISNEYDKVNIYPPKDQIFEAFNKTPFDKVKVVLIGQDPYIHKGEAHGLCFSVNKGVAIPPSLRNIYKELERSVKGFKKPAHGYLIEWAEQGVLMLNATLTVLEGKSNSHQKYWENITNDIIDVISKKKHLVYLLWGKFAQNKCKNVSKTDNCVLICPHPSPLSRGYEGNNHFNLCNEYLVKNNIEPINWSLSP